MSPHDFVEFYALIDVDPSRENEIHLVLEATKNDTVVKWQAGSYDHLAVDTMRQYYLCTAYQIPLKWENVDLDKIHTSFWNSGRTPIKVKDFGFRVRSGNLNRYALYEKYR